MYKFYPVLNHVACISARAVAVSVASAVMGQPSVPASDVQATHSQKRRVEEKGDEPVAKRRLISKQGRFLKALIQRKAWALAIWY